MDFLKGKDRVKLIEIYQKDDTNNKNINLLYRP